MQEVIMAKYGEIALKGLNKNTFEDLLVRNIKRRIKSLGSFVCTSKDIREHNFETITKLSRESVEKIHAARV